MNETSSLGRSALSLACSSGSVDVAAMLLSFSPELDRQVAAMSRNAVLAVRMEQAVDHIRVVPVCLYSRVSHWRYTW